MKPIRLTIKGLNSFIESQTIDFEKLTDRGLFGIIGPTGSGKSTILDGITLALYGDVARKSSNYINSNCNTAAVSFEFQISGAETKRYLVEREFKIDKKTGNPRSSKCKVLDVTTGEAVVLADSVSGVTTVCREAIGLTLEDFTRTVVLPQGKFSEFLKLTGKERRDMLERLFHLQQYGDDLARKLSRQIAEERNNYNFLMGEFSGYEDVNQENKNRLEEELSEAKNQLSKVAEELTHVQKAFTEKQEIWNLQSELQQYRQKETEFQEKEQLFQGIEEEIQSAEAAEKVLPYLNAYEGTIAAIAEQEQQFTVLQQENVVLEEQKKVAVERYAVAKEEKESKLPKLQLQEASAKEALEEQKLLEEVIRTIKKLEEDTKQLHGKRHGLEAKKQEVMTSITELTCKIGEGELECEQLKVPSDLKEKVQKGVQITDKLEEVMLVIRSSKERYDATKQQVEEEKRTISILSEQQKEKNMLLEKAREDLQRLLLNCPGESNELLKLQQELGIHIEKWAKYETSQKVIAAAKLEMEQAKQHAEQNTKVVQESNAKLFSLKETKKAIEKEHLAHSLRVNLKEGEICPVCGAAEHHTENLTIVPSGDVEQLDLEIGQVETALRHAEQQVTKASMRVETATEKLQEEESKIAELGDGFREKTVEEKKQEFESRKQAMEEYLVQKESLEKTLTTMEQERATLVEKANGLNALLLRNEALLEELRVEYSKNRDIYKENHALYTQLVEETTIHDFKVKKKEILDKELKREALLTTIKKQRDHIVNVTELQKQMEDQLVSLKEALATNVTLIVEKKKIREEKERSIRAKVGEIQDIELHILKLQAFMEEITKQLLDAEQQKQMAEEKHQVCSESLLKSSTMLNELSKRKEQELTVLQVVLAEQNFPSAEVVKQKQMTKGLLLEKKEQVRNYHDAVERNKGAIDSVLAKLGERTLEESAWIRIQELKLEKESEYTEKAEAKLQVENRVKQMEEKLLELRDLLSKKEKLDHKLALLGDLEKLFKGKKFVEYVAATRLNYISIEASKKLKEITNGNYGLEVDENAKFIIRDYKNGGAARDASTLSGGETFIASLALALALSAEIQLKGTAPLELFFLDEGFGTLDDNLLEVVMNSIERIHNEKLKVGLISHVESIKSRVPVKLVITPAQAGEGGSKVKIERN